MDTLNRITQLAIRQFGIETSAVGIDVPVDEYGVDSLGLLEFLFALEEEFQIRFPQEPIDEPQTLRKLAELVDRLLHSPAVPVQASL